MIRSLRRDDASANLAVKIPSGGTLGCADWCLLGQKRRGDDAGVEASIHAGLLVRQCSLFLTATLLFRYSGSLKY
jgi:hypothetical protein